MTESMCVFGTSVYIIISRNQRVRVPVVITLEHFFWASENMKGHTYDTITD